MYQQFGDMQDIDPRLRGGMFRGLLNNKPQGLAQRKPVMMGQMQPTQMPGPPIAEPVQLRPWQETQKNWEDGKDNIGKLLGRGGGVVPGDTPPIFAGAGGDAGVLGAPSMSGIGGEAPSIMAGMGSAPAGVGDAGNAAKGGLKGLFGA